MITTVVGKRGQVTLPSKIRKETGIQEGDRLVLRVENDRIILEPLPETLLDLRGSIPVDSPQDFDEIRRQVIAVRANQKARRGE